MQVYTEEQIHFSQQVLELYNYVYSTCSQRKPSHSHLHMHKVYTTSKEIYSKLHPEDTDFSNPIFLAVATIAWLHDVSDHKYDDEEGNLQKGLELFLGNFVNKINESGILDSADSEIKNLFDDKILMNIIERISFSKEKKNGSKDWESKMTKMGIYVRNIVSDADKLDAIGLFGLERCREYTIERYEKKNPELELTGEELFVLKDMFDHYHEKLKLLGSDYIRTDVGKEMAVPLDQEMEKGIQEIEMKIIQLKAEE